MECPIVTTKQGQLTGRTCSDFCSNTFYSYLGIPYAKPPIGALRFQAPQDLEPWSGVFRAVKEGNAACQVDSFTNKYVGNEDCLFLNIHTKNLAGKSPVIFWIHGGELLHGSGGKKFHGPEFLLSEDIVLVTLNYRLGIFGFINCNDESLGVPDHLGFLDILKALEWVQVNSTGFGGDPGNVTVAGHSAGAAVVHSLILYPFPEGLFQRAILQSNTAYMPQFLTAPGLQLIGKCLNLEDEKTIYQYLMEYPSRELLRLQQKVIDIKNKDSYKYMPFRGIIRDKVRDNLTFVGQPITVMENQGFKNVPILIGMTSNEEGIVRFNDTFEEVLERCISHAFHLEYASPIITEIKTRIQLFYNQQHYKPIEIITDLLFRHGILTTSILHSKKAPVYLYKLSLDTKLNIYKKLLGVQSPGACHGDDIGYLFKTFATLPIEQGSREEDAVKKMVKLWCNFARCGNPTPAEDDLIRVKWETVSEGNLTYLDIGEELKMKEDDTHKKRQFWEDLYKEYNQYTS